MNSDSFYRTVLEILNLFLSEIHCRHLLFPLAILTDILAYVILLTTHCQHLDTFFLCICPPVLNTEIYCLHCGQ